MVAVCDRGVAEGATRRSVLGSVLAGLLASVAHPVLAQRAPRSAARLIEAARAQVGVTTLYDPAYVPLAFPGGDVERGRGVCTDVVVRAYRDAFGIDLQAAVNADMGQAFARYPRRWGLTRPDPNIDHRRVANLAVYFERQGARLPMPVPEAAVWRPGDLFTGLVGGRLPHIGIISDRLADGRPLIIHNIGAGAREEDGLLAHPLTGRFRWSLEA
jgi:uncharacterized protein